MSDVSSHELLLSVKNLSVSYHDEPVFHNISFDLYRGDVLTIIGPNGAGKTTLCKALMGLLNPTSGSYAWHTQRISYLPPQELLSRKNLPPLSVEDFFSFKRKTHDQMSQALNSVGLDSVYLSRQFYELSTGQFQRMVIAWALCDDPEVLVFDEPTSGIDLGGADTIYSLLHSFWQHKKLTIMLITHDLSVVWEHANKVICLNKKKFCMGPPQKILTPENLQEVYQTNIKFYIHEHRDDK